MDVDPKLSDIIAKVNAGEFDEFANDLEGLDVGIYVPSFTDGVSVSLMPDGLSQIENNLKIIYKKRIPGMPVEGQPVAWLGSTTGKDSKCRHGGTESCSHCTDHGNPCKHCTGHKKGTPADISRRFPQLDAPELDYDQVANEIRGKDQVLGKLRGSGMGLALLHGHNDKHKFTKLPTEMVAVIADNETSFRTLEEVSTDKSFVPNIWRFVNGALQPAGGYSTTKS